jgi:uncharacterized protein YcbX
MPAARRGGKTETDAVNGVAGEIAGLWTYPVKGCRGIAHEAAWLEPRGLAHDRRWMIVTPDGRFRTQRELPRLATIVVGLIDGTLTLRCGEEQVAVRADDYGQRITVAVWNDRIAALAPDAEADSALSDWLGQGVRLVRFPDGERRACDPAFAAPDDHTAFADGFPLLVTTEGSLGELNDALLERGRPPVTMDRFRPNIVAAGVPARTEDRHGTLQLGAGTAVRLVKPCDRCIVTTTDQQSGQRLGNEPIATLLRTRRNRATGGASFGQNGVPDLPAGAGALLRVGQPCRFV